MSLCIHAVSFLACLLLLLIIPVPFLFVPGMSMACGASSCSAHSAWDGDGVPSVRAQPLPFKPQLAAIWPIKSNWSLLLPDSPLLINHHYLHVNLTLLSWAWKSVSIVSLDLFLSNYHLFLGMIFVFQWDPVHPEVLLLVEIGIFQFFGHALVREMQTYFSNA